MFVVHTRPNAELRRSDISRVSRRTGLAHTSCFYSNRAGTSRQTPSLRFDYRHPVWRLRLFQQKRPAATGLRTLRPQMQQAARPLPREDENESAAHPEI